MVSISDTDIEIRFKKDTGLNAKDPNNNEAYLVWKNEQLKLVLQKLYLVRSEFKKLRSELENAEQENELLVRENKKLISKV